MEVRRTHPKNRRQHEGSGGGLASMVSTNAGSIAWKKPDRRRIRAARRRKGEPQKMVQSRGRTECFINTFNGRTWSNSGLMDAAMGCQPSLRLKQQSVRTANDGISVDAPSRRHRASGETIRKCADRRSAWRTIPHSPCQGECSFRSYLQHTQAPYYRSPRLLELIIQHYSMSFSGPGFT